MVPLQLAILHIWFGDGIKKGGRRFISFAVVQCRSLLGRSILLSVGLLVVGLSLRVIFLMPIIKEQVRDVYTGRQTALAEFIADDIARGLSRRLTILTSMAAYFPLNKLGDSGQTEAWLRERHALSATLIKELIMLPVAGANNAASPSDAVLRSADFAQELWFQQVLQTGQTIVGRLENSMDDEEPVLVLAVPVRDAHDRIVAVLAGLVDSGFLNLRQQSRMGKTGRVMLVLPKDKLTITASDQSTLFQSVPVSGTNSIYDRALMGGRGTRITFDPVGDEVLSSIVSISGSDWFLMAQVSMDEVYGSVHFIQSNLIRNSFVFGVLALFPVISVFRYHLFHLRRTAALFHRMASGEIALQTVPVVLADEVGDLIAGFNVLVARLDEITDQKLASERAQLQSKERHETMLRQWMTDASHELRTPIAVLRAQIEAIQDGIHTANAKTLGVLHREVDGLSRLVDDLNVLALSDVHQFRCNMVVVDPLDVLENVVWAFQDRYRSGGLEIILPPASKAGHFIYFDPIHLRRVYSNFLENTLRYTDSGGRLVVTVKACDAVITIQFDDTAPGVPEESLSRLFERFYRVDASRSRESGGSGIGLAVCQAIVLAYGGTICAFSSPMGGLRLVLSFQLIDRGM